MIDPASAILMASTAFNALRKGVQMGRDLEGMAKDLSRWGKACADFDFAEQQTKNPPWYTALGGGVEAQAMEIFAQRKQLEKQRAELKDWICSVLGPSQWEELLSIEADIRKQKREHEFRRIEKWQAIWEWTLGTFLFALCTVMLVMFVFVMRSAT